MDTATLTDRHCASDERCRAYDHIAKHPAPVNDRDPLCDACLTAAERDTRTIVYDYVDLAQLQDPTLSQALDAQPRGKSAPPMPLKGEPEALQREIHHVLTTWEIEIRAAAGLSEPATGQRHGAEVQRAVTILAPRLRQLAALPATTVYPTGCEDDPTDMAGWQAVHHLQHLRARARSMLGRTHRTRQLPGTCSTCGGGLYRDDPRYEGDPCDVYCTGCDTRWTHEDYERYVGLMLALPWTRA